MLGTLDVEQVEQVLRNEIIGRIGCYAEGRVYVVPVTYAYDGECLYAHSAVGMKVRMMRANPAVCFEVDHMDNLANWQSVIAWGTFEELTGDDAKLGLAKLIHRVMPLMTSETAQPSHGMPGSPSHPGGHAADVAHVEAVLFRIRLHERTGRFERRP